MDKELVAKQSIDINALATEVWRALTSPEEIKKYFFGTTVTSDWKVGGPIKFTGEWEGKTYEDKGTILELELERKLVYSYWSSFNGNADIPENYANITYLLSPVADGTRLEILQDGFDSEERRIHSESNWKLILDGLKEILHSKSMA